MADEREFVNTSLTAGFDSGDSDDEKKGQLKITNDYGFHWGAEYRFRIWPGYAMPDLKIVTNNGVVYPIQGPYLVSGQEYVSFSNSDTANTQYPMVSLIGASVAGGALDLNGDPVSISFTFENNQLKASEPFYGGAIVSYASTYYVWGWQPEITGWSWWNRESNDFDYAIQILAFYKGAVTTHNVTYATVQSNDYMEAYRVTSEYIVDKDGGWELPPDWPADNAYPLDNSQGPNMRAFQKLERTHEIMTANTSGGVSLDRQFVTLLQPYTTSVDYDPVYTYQKGTPRDGFESVFLDLDWSSIEASVLSRYDGIQI